MLSGCVGAVEGVFQACDAGALAVNGELLANPPFAAGGATNGLVTALLTGGCDKFGPAAAEVSIGVW